MPRAKIKILNFGLLFCILLFGFRVFSSFAQETELELTVDTTAQTIPLPKIFKPNIDLSGRGFHRQNSWPQALAAKEALEAWQKDLGFNGMYRLSYDLWDIAELAKDKDSQDKLLANYEALIKKISDAGGLVILNLFGTPAGLGKALDKKSVPRDPRKFKALIKSYIKNLSCDKKYNIWYEVWNAPDLDDFFLGRRQDYLNIYKTIAQAVKELEAETKIHILLGGPSSSGWSANTELNTVLTPERSLIYELIKFCYANRLPLDFVSWHAYSTDPKVDAEVSIYKKTTIELIRDWLSYFRFNRQTPLVVDEWNFDNAQNWAVERNDKSHITASYLLSRLKNMHEAGLDQQVYFCLEDFQNNKENIWRNLGVFWFDAERSEYRGGHKPTYAILKILASLGSDMLEAVKTADDFIGAIATKKEDEIKIVIYNYIDPEIARSFLSRNIATLNDAERKYLLSLVKSGGFDKVMRHEMDVSSARLPGKLKAFINKAQELNDLALKCKGANRNLQLKIKKLKEDCLYQRYAIDASYKEDNELKPREEKEIAAADLYEETLSIEPYSVNLIVLTRKPKELPPENPAVPQVPAESKPLAAEETPAQTNP